MVSCVTIEDAYEALVSHAAMTGLEFVHGSGKRKTQLQKDIELRGGKVTGSVSKNTDYLINNDAHSASSKNKKAKELGIPVITEKEFIEMFIK